MSKYNDGMYVNESETLFYLTCVSLVSLHKKLPYLLQVNSKMLDLHSYLSVCSYYVTYLFHSEPECQRTLARNRRDI